MSKRLLPSTRNIFADLGFTDAESKLMKPMAEQIVRLERQHDELAEALRDMVEIAEATLGWIPTPPGADGPLIKARDILARIDAEKQ
jgi:hypothetical protein